MAVVIENGLWLRKLKVQLFAGRGRQQKILGEKGFVHGWCRVRVYERVCAVMDVRQSHKGSIVQGNGQKIA